MELEVPAVRLSIWLPVGKGVQKDSRVIHIEWVSMLFVREETLSLAITA